MTEGGGAPAFSDLAGASDADAAAAADAGAGAGGGGGGGGDKKLIYEGFEWVDDLHEQQHHRASGSAGAGGAGDAAGGAAEALSSDEAATATLGLMVEPRHASAAPITVDEQVHTSEVAREVLCEKCGADIAARVDAAFFALDTNDNNHLEFRELREVRNGEAEVPHRCCAGRSGGRGRGGGGGGRSMAPITDRSIADTRSVTRSSTDDRPLKSITPSCVLRRRRYLERARRLPAPRERGALLT